MTDTINYLRRCADRKLLEASLTPAQCREAVRWRDIAERALLRLRIERAQCRQQSESAAALHADLQIERDDVRVLRDAEIEQIGRLQHAERERDAALAEVDRITEAGRAHIRRAAAFEAQRDELLVAMHGIGKALGIPEGERSPYSVMCGTLECVNRLAEIDAQEPVAWVPMHPRKGALWSMTTATPSEERLPSNYPLSPLYARPSTAQEFKA